MRPWPDEVEITAENAQALRDLVEAKLPQPSSDPGDAGGVVLEPHRGFIGHRVHGAKLDQCERLAAHADAILDDEERAPRIELDRQGDEGEEGSERHQRDDGEQKTQRSTGRQLEPGLLEVLRIGEIARRERLDGELAGQALIHLRAVFDGDTANPGL